jgi:hypothetical protein
VWLVVGIAVPVLLSILSIVFGRGLQRAAGACRDSASRAGSAMDRATRRVAGDEVDEPETAEERRVRIGADHILHGVRAVTPEQAQHEAMRAAEREGLEDAEEWAARRAQVEADKWEPPEAWLEREEEQEKRKAARRPR